MSMVQERRELHRDPRLATTQVAKPVDRRVSTVRLPALPGWSWAILWTVAWWALVLAATRAIEGWVLVGCGLLVVAGAIRGHAAPRRWRVVAGTVSGYLLVDGVLALSGLVVYQGEWTVGSLPPLWIAMLWALLCSLAPLALPRICWRPGVWEAVLACGGPLAYLGASSWHGIALPTTAVLPVVGALYLVAALVLRPLLQPGRSAA